MEIPTLLKGISIQEIPFGDSKELIGRVRFSNPTIKVFEVISNNEKYFVVADEGMISENDLDIFESGLEKF